MNLKFGIEWKCGNCKKIYNTYELLRLEKVKAVESDIDPDNQHGYTSVCTCGYRFHLDTWRLHDTLKIKIDEKYVDMLVSTVDLELNHGFFGKDLWYETGIFIDIDNKDFITMIYEDRYENKEDAIYWDAIYSAQQTKDEGYILAGEKDGQSWLIKVTGKSLSANLLKNPGFETSYGSMPMYWNKYQTGTKAVFTYPETGRNGGKSVAIKYLIREAGKVALWQQQGIIVSPSSQYKLSGYMKLAGVTGSGATPRPGGVSLRVSWYKSDGGLIRIDYINKKGTIGWTKYEKIVTSPSNAAKATMGGDLFDSSGKVWFDDLSFVKIS